MLKYLKGVAETLNKTYQSIEHKVTIYFSNFIRKKS